MANRCSNDMSMNANGDNCLSTLDSEELRAAKSKNGIENKLMFAICLKFLQLEGRFLMLLFCNDLIIEDRFLIN